MVVERGLAVRIVVDTCLSDMELLMPRPRPCGAGILLCRNLAS